MARSAWTDFLQDHAFWLGDVGPTSLTAAPLFSPLCAFSAISAPEIQLETKEIKEGNNPLVKKVLTGGGSISNITLQRGAHAWDSDFYRWIMAAMHGTTSLALGASSGISALLGMIGAGSAGLRGSAKIGGPTYRRNLLLVQFFAHLPVDKIASAAAFGGLVGGTRGFFNRSAGGIIGAVGAAAMAGTESLVSTATGMGDLAVRMPARAWLLYGCIPKRYKAAGDLDATSAAVSIAELELELESFDELSLMA